jgi:hypothetical protein
MFADPDRFDPDRFAPPRAEDGRAYAYIPFGGGRHKCMGSSFAMLQLKTILVEILREHRLASTTDPVEEDFGIMVIGPKSPLMAVGRQLQFAPPRQVHPPEPHRWQRTTRYSASPGRGTAAVRPFLRVVTPFRFNPSLRRFR